MYRLWFLNRLSWYTRIPVKWAIFGLAVLIVCFPNPRLLVSHVKHWRDPNALIEPNAEALQPLLEELRPSMHDDLAPADALKRVQSFVYEKIPYEWDWITWGAVDYLPTVTEAIEKGREDCDGRAVVAASLLRNFGFEAQIVTDFSHVWVKTDKGETMGPGKKKAIVATEEGLIVQSNALAEIPGAVAYGVAVFPPGRELILVGVFWLLLLRRGGGVLCGIVALVGLVGGLLLLRAGGATYLEPMVWVQVSGAVCLFGSGVLMVTWGSFHARRVCRAASPEC